MTKYRGNIISLVEIKLELRNLSKFKTNGSKTLPRVTISILLPSNSILEFSKSCISYFHFFVVLKEHQSKDHRLFQAWKLDQKWITCAWSSCHTQEQNIHGSDTTEHEKKKKARMHAY